MSQNQTIRPVFTLQSVTLTVTVNGVGSVVDNSTPVKLNCVNASATTPLVCSANYNSGTTITLTATPGTGYSLTSFSACTPSTTASCSITLNAASNTMVNVAATFQINSYLLNVSTTGGNGTGTVTSNANNLGGTINCGPNNQPPSGCGLEETFGWSVTLTAKPTGTESFAGWSASSVPGFVLPCPGTSTTCTFTMPVAPAGLTVTTTFTAGAGTPTASLNPTSLTFGGQVINTTSTALPVTVTNTGGANLVLGPTPLALSGADPGDFAIASGATCTPGLSIAPKGTCIASISFAPTATGTLSATLIFTDNSGGVAGTTQTVALSGTGTAAGTPTASLNPTSLTFAGQVISTTSPAQTVTVTNTGTGTLNFAGFTITGANSGDFGVPLPNTPAMCNPLGGTLAAGASCTINVLFTPTATGTRTATLKIADNATGSPQTVPLTGTGTAAGTPTASLNPTSLTFGGEVINTTSTALPVTVTNTGGANLVLGPTPLALSGANPGDFAIASGATCTAGLSIAPKGTCVASISFAPTATGTLSATLEINDNAPGSPQMVPLTGTGTNSPVTIGLAPGSPSTVSTTPGSSAVFGLTLTSLPGVTGKVQLGCTVNSPNAADITCDLVPSSIVLTGKPINVAIVVETFCKGAVPGFGPSLPGGLVAGLAMLLASMSLCGAMWTFKRRPRWALSFGVLILIAVGMSACSSLATSPGGKATPVGPYPLIVTATAPNGATSSVPLTLVVGP
jgi:hypothetical protein